MSYHYEYLYIALTFMCNIHTYYDYEDVVEYQSSPPYTLYQT